MEIFIFPVQLTTSRNGNLTWLIHALAMFVIIHSEHENLFYTFAVFSLFGEYVVRFFSLSDGVFLPCDHGLNF